MFITTLDKIKINKTVKIININSNLEIKNRLEELGFIKGNLVEVLFKSPFNDPIAYKIKGSTIALRKDISKNIVVMDNE